MQKILNCFQHNNPALKIKVLDYTYTSEPSINTALPLKTNRLKQIVYYLCVVLTFGFVWLLTKWSAKKKAIMTASVSSLEEATYLLIHDDDTEGEETIVEKMKKVEIRLKRECFAFKYHDRTYIYIEQKQVFVPIRYQELGLHLDKLKKDKFYPYSEKKRLKLLEYYGQNVMNLPVQTKIDIFIQQMLTPYQVFQTYGIILWIIQSYYIFAITLLTYSLYVYWSNSNEIIKNQEKLAFESYFDVECKVLINDNQIESEDEQEKDVELCNLDNKIDEHKSEIMKNQFNGIEDLDIDNQMTVVRKQEKRRSREVKNQENTLINNKNIRFKRISSHKLVPGDIFILNELDIVPCDCIILRGEAIVNQKYTTGESYLVRKEQIQNFTYIKENQKSFLLYLGTQIVKIKNYELKMKQRLDNQISSIETSMKHDKIDSNNDIVCMVTQTNFNTLRGKFLRAIRYQNKQEENFFKETVYFIYLIMGFTTIVYFIIFAIIGEHNSSLSMFIYYLDMLVTAIPPTLPTVLSVGINFVQHRLKKYGINCVLPKSTLTGGKVDTIILEGNNVFGKEFQIHSAAIGTKANRAFGINFTSIDDFYGYNDSDSISSIDANDFKVKRKERDEFYKIGTLFINALASCHTLQFFRDSVEGSIHEKKIYQFCKASNIREDIFETSNHTIEVHKIIRFKEKNRKMGVVVSLKENKSPKELMQQDKQRNRFSNEVDLFEYADNNQTIKPRQKSYQQKMEEGMIKAKEKQRYLFIKGTPEKILSMCLPHTFPANAYEYIVDMAEKGFILYCYAMKEINFNLKQNFDYHELISYNQFSFLGFIILQQVKSEQNIEAINILNESKIKMILLSEDRELETTSKAIMNNLCTKNQLLLCNITRNKDKIYCKGHIEWESSQDQVLSQFLTEFDDFGKSSKVSLSSPLFEELFMKKQIQSAEIIFDKTIIYNKMQLKHARNLYNQLEKRKRISMAIGIGGNLSECASLSLQLQRESSSLLSSFYTKSCSLLTIVNCLRVCRAGLSTNFHCFSMMILFSLIQFTTVAILNCNYQGLTDYQALYEDLFITFPIFVTINLTLPSNKLSKELPPNSFFSLRNSLSMIGQLTMQFLAQLGFILYVLSIDHFKQIKQKAMFHYVETGQFLVKSQIALGLFVLSNNLYLGTVLSTSVSKPFRKPFYTNPFYTINLIIIWCYNTLIVFAPTLSPDSMRMKNLNSDSEFVLVLALLIGNLTMVIMYMYENFLAFLWSAENPFRRNRQVEGSMGMDILK